MGGAGAALQKAYDFTVKGETPTPPPPVAPPPPPPTPQNAEVADAQKQAAANERKARGRASTLLTGAGGVTTAATTAGRTLLGS